MPRTHRRRYPPSTKTLAYFVSQTDWSRHKADGKLHFSRYFIAQHASTMRPSELSGFKRFVHAKNGAVPDHTRLPTELKSTGHANLGVLSEAGDSISFGVLMRVDDPSSKETHDLVAINSALAVKDVMLSLYVFSNVDDAESIEQAKQASTDWLACLRARNQK